MSEAIITATQASISCQSRRQIVSGGFELLVWKPTMRMTTQMIMNEERPRREQIPILVMNFRLAWRRRRMGMLTTAESLVEIPLVSALYD